MLSRDGRQKLKMQIWIQQHLASNYPICKDAIATFGLMHRLDVQTSGVLLCAKSYQGAYWIQMQWCSHYVTKEYVALVHGWVDPSLTEIRKRICLDDESRDDSKRRISTRCTVSDSGKPAYTEVAAITHLFRTSIGTCEALNKVGKERYSLVVLKLHTG